MLIPFPLKFSGYVGSNTHQHGTTPSH